MLNSRKPSIWARQLPYLICSLAALFYAYDYLQRVLPSAATNELMLRFHIHAPGLGILTSLFFYGYFLMQIPAGALIDRFGARKIMTFMLLITVIATLLFALTHSFFLAVVARFLIGVGTSVAFISALYVGSQWFSHKRFAMYTGLVQLLGSAGAILGGGPIAALILHWGFKNTTLFISALGFALMILIGLLVRNHPKKAHTISKVQHHYPFKEVFSNQQNWWSAFFAFMAWTPTILFAVLWGTPFLRNFYHISHVDAASMVAFFWIGTAVAGPILGWWSNQIRSRRHPMWLCMVIGIISSLILFYGHPSCFVADILLVIMGSASSSQLFSFALMTENNRLKAHGLAMGFANMMVILSGLTFQILVGFILDWLWNGRMLHGVAVYTIANYQTALLFIPLAYFVGLLIVIFFIKETHCRPKWLNETKKTKPISSTPKKSTL